MNHRTVSVALFVRAVMDFLSSVGYGNSAVMDISPPVDFGVTAVMDVSLPVGYGARPVTDLLALVAPSTQARHLFRPASLLRSAPGSLFGANRNQSLPRSILRRRSPVRRDLQATD